MKYFTVNKYFKKLPLLLKQRYGASDSYTYGQIKTTVYDCGFNKKNLPYALAIFMKEADLKVALNQHHNNFNANQLRAYIARRFFKGNENYSIQAAGASKIGNNIGESVGGTVGD